MLAMDWGAVSLLGWAGLVYTSVLSLVLAYILWNLISLSARSARARRPALLRCLTALLAGLMRPARLSLPLHRTGPPLVQLAGAPLIAILTHGVSDSASGRRARPDQRTGRVEAPPSIWCSRAARGGDAG